VTLHRTLRGEGRPVVLLHAGGLDSRMFEHDMPKLEKVAAVLRYDRSGSGRSPAATGPIDRVEELRTVSNEAFAGRPCALVGSSYGGQLAIDFALAHPTLVAGLMLIGPGLTGHQDSDQRCVRMEALAAAAQRGGSALAELWLNDPHLCPHGLPRPVEQQVRDMLQDNAGIFVSPPPSVGAGPAVGRLGGLDARCQVFVGEYDDSDNLAIAHTLRATVEGATLDIVSRAGHFPMLERAGWLPQILTAFLTAQAT
jgi:3-oxoadipate enol-lactonase